MPFNSERMIVEIRENVEKMVGQVTGKEADKATADQMERQLFRMLLQLGAQLLALFFAKRSEASNRTRPCFPQRLVGTCRRSSDGGAACWKQSQRAPIVRTRTERSD